MLSVVPATTDQLKQKTSLSISADMRRHVSIESILSDLRKHIQNPHLAPQLSTNQGKPHPLTMARAEAKGCDDPDVQKVMQEQITLHIALLLQSYLDFVCETIQYPISTDLLSKLTPNSMTASRLYQKLETLDHDCKAIHNSVSTLATLLSLNTAITTRRQALEQAIISFDIIFSDSACGIYFDSLHTQLNALKENLKQIDKQYQHESHAAFKKFILTITVTKPLPGDWVFYNNIKLALDKDKLNYLKQTLDFQYTKNILEILTNPTIRKAKLTLAEQQLNQISDRQIQDHLRKLINTYKNHILNKYVGFISSLAEEKTPPQPGSEETFAYLKSHPDFISAQDILTFFNTPDHKGQNAESYYLKINTISFEELRDTLRATLCIYFKPRALQSFIHVIQRPTPPEPQNFFKWVTETLNIVSTSPYFFFIKEDQTIKFTCDILSEFKTPKANLTECRNKISKIGNPVLKTKLESLIKTYQSLPKDTPSIFSYLWATHTNTAKPHPILTGLEELINEMKTELTTNPSRFYRCISIFGFYEKSLQGTATGIKQLTERLDKTCESDFTNAVNANNLVDSLLKTLETRRSKNYWVYCPIAKVRAQASQEFYDKWYEKLQAAKEELPRVGLAAKASNYFGKGVSYTTNKLSRIIFG